MNFIESNAIMTEANTFFIPPAEQSAQRLDKFLAEKLPQLSRAGVQRLIESGFVSCEEEIVLEKDYKVKVGDAFVVVIPPAQEADPKPQDIPIDVVYEDDDIVVVNKPAGMTVHPAPGAWDNTLVNALLFHCKDNLSGVGGVKRPGIVHRIDKETSGLLVVAKNDVAHRALSEQFFEHSIERTYYAVVYGSPNPLSGKIETFIARSKFDRKKMAITQNSGKLAITNYKTVKTFKNCASLVQCNLQTGRTHQIRVHMSSLGNSLIGDKVYGKAKKHLFAGCSEQVCETVYNFDRQALHAASLGFVHPRSKEQISFVCDMPDDMKNLIKSLEIL